MIKLHPSIQLTIAGLENSPIKRGVSISPLTHDFGIVPVSQELSHVFLIPNKSRDTWHVVHLDSSCGCTSALCSSKTIAPGEALKVDVRYKSPSKSGTVFQKVDVVLEGGMIVPLKIRARVRTAMFIQNSKIQLGRCSIGTNPHFTAVVENFGTKDWDILEVHGPEELLWDVRKNTTTPPARESWTVNGEIFVSQDGPVSRKIESNIIAVDSNGETYSQPFEIEYRVAPEVTVSPRTIHFGILGSVPKKRNITLIFANSILDTESMPPTVEVAHDIGEAAKVMAMPHKGGAVTISIQINEANISPGIYQKTIKVHWKILDSDRSTEVPILFEVKNQNKLFK